MAKWFYGVWTVLGLLLCFIFGMTANLILKVTSLVNMISGIDFQNRLFEAMQGLSGIMR